MRVAWQVEKDPAARRVLDHHWPDVPTHDDVTTLKGSDVPAVDVLCGGFPCQDLSVAGGRAGLAGERSGLFHEFIRLADELAPRWVLIENVPGLLSSNDGRDMGIVLGVLADLGYGWCYRVLDAQYFGVAQRRRRVFIVGCAGDPRAAAQVLLEPDSCNGDSAPSRATGQGAPVGTLGGVGPGGGWRCGADEAAVGQLLPVPPPAGALAFMWQAGGDKTSSGACEEGFSPTLPRSQSVAVAYPLTIHGRGAEMGEEELYNALRAGDGGSSRQPLIAFSDSTAVRRLMPVECERLQGFPDGWTAGETDSARYRLLGNAVCVPVAQWIGARLERVA
jgi:DNA (cytosine-5)-methyltransferase 1